MSLSTVCPGILSRGLDLESRPQDCLGWNPLPLVYKASSITSTPRRLKRLTPLSPTSEVEFNPLLLSGNGFFQEAQAGGSYPAAIKLKAEPNPDCDPTQQECEMWLPGNYTVKIGNISVKFHVRHLRSLWGV